MGEGPGAGRSGHAFTSEQGEEDRGRRGRCTMAWDGFGSGSFGEGGDWGAGSGRAVARLHRRLLSRAHAGAARAGAELSRGAGTLLPAVRSGHWCLSDPPRQPGSGGAAAVECLNHPRPTPEPPSLDRGYGPARHLRCPWAYHPAGGGGAGWQGERTASAPFVASEQHSFCAKTAASKQRLRQFHSANDDVRRPSGPRRPYAHPSSTTTDRARKRASPIYFSHPPTHLIVAAAAAQQCSAFRSSGIWGGLGRRRRQSSRSPTPAPFVARARGCGASRS